MVTLNVVFQMDALEQLKPQTDSSLALIEEGIRRGHQLHYYTPSTLCWREGQLTSQVSSLAMIDEKIVEAGEKQWVDLTQFDLLFIRQDPPFNMDYLTSTYLLDHLIDKVVMINDPRGIRQSPEKLLITHFPDLMPPTLITRKLDMIEDFRRQHQDIVIKPLYEFGGESVVRLRPEDQNLNPIIELFEKAYPAQPWMIQKFLPQIFEGDRRLFLLEGKLIGGYSRLPMQDSIRSNNARGGKAVAVTLSARDHEIAERLEPTLKKLGLIFVGIDLIGDYLTEINVTSPTGIRVLDQLSDIKIASIIWDKLEIKCKIV